MRLKRRDFVLAAFTILFFSMNCYSSEEIYYDEIDNEPQEIVQGGLGPDEIEMESDRDLYAYNDYYGNEYYANEYAYNQKSYHSQRHSKKSYAKYTPRLPEKIPAPGEKVIIVDPNVHAWGAYSADGNLVRSGLATAGSKWCSDLKRPCRTSRGTFRIRSLGGPGCYSRKFPLGKGGAPMPYCMFFNNTQALHGSHEVAAANLSHGCVRLRVGDAEWLRYNFANIGTKVIIRPY